VYLTHALRGGATVVTMPRFDLPEFLGLLQRHRATTTIVVPPIMLALAKHPVVDDYDLSALRLLGAGAAPLGADIEQACARRLGVPVIQGYGMTETSPMIAIGGDPATGEDTEPGEPGELWVLVPLPMSGYLHNPDATAATVDPQGWLHTGDLATIDDDGFVFIVDRVKELIKYKAYQVAPAELEALLVRHPAVADAAVIGVPDAEAGESPKAFVVRRGEVTEADLTTFVAERVAPYKKVRSIEFVDQIPKSPTGKILRRLLVERERAARAT
jgi:acyl-CoA synthetase (AMP-forming)/AMP-acid ligase II